MAEIIESKGMHMEHSKDFASKATGNAGLTLGIIGTALGALNAIGNGGGILGGILGNSTPTVVNPYMIPNNGWTSNGWSVPAPNTAQDAFIEREVCRNYLNTTEQFYKGQIANMKELNDAFYRLDKQDTNNSFALYKNQRDIKDDLSGQISALNAKVDVMAAVRPYQDALINAKIDNVAQTADFNLFRRTCRMLQGELVLPDTSVSGFPSYSTCCGNN